MKNFTLLTLFLLLTSSAFAQLVRIDEPSNLFGYPDFTSPDDWGQLLQDTLITAEAIYVDDGSANPTQGCEAVMNDLTGKIALIDRGGCEFGLKALNAENAGAVAAIILNANPGEGPVGMGVGANGGDVTIPAIMLSYEVGQDLLAAINGGETIVMTIGDIRFPNDVATSLAQVVFPRYGVYPSTQLEDTDTEIALGATVLNRGTNDASNPTVTVTVEDASMTLFSDSKIAETTLATDSTAFVDFDGFSMNNAAMGVYTFTTAVSADSTDQLMNNDVITTDVVVTENIYSNGSWDLENNQPAQNNAYTVGGGGDVGFLANFAFPKGAGTRIDSVWFYVSTQAASLEAIDGSVEAYLYRVADGDQNGSIATSEMEIVGFAPVNLGGITETDTYVKSAFLGWPDLEEIGIDAEDGENYMVMVRYLGTESTFFGFDETRDLQSYMDINTSSDGVISDLELPYIVVDGFENTLPDMSTAALFANTRASVAIALVLGETISSNTTILTNVEMNLFPNPSSAFLNVNVTFEDLSQEVEMHIIDMNGKLLSTRAFNGVKNVTDRFDVSNYAAGQYQLLIQTENGQAVRSFSVTK